MRSFILYIGLWCCCISVSAQSAFSKFLTPSDTLHTKRRNAVILSETLLATTALVGLNEVWYADFERSKFHTVDDTGDWLQLDKVGHAFAAYQLGRHGAQLLRWSGVAEREQLIYGATLGFTFLTAIEVLDGFSSAWGFSWGDVGANALGTGLYISQELLWKEQRVALKFSFMQTPFAAQRPDLLGTSFAEQILKDYNGQTYWLSCNLDAFFKEKGLPKWLNVAFGYGGEGLLSGSRTSGLALADQQERYRQYYLSLDVNLYNIPTNSTFLKTIFSVFNMIKIPFPALEISKKGFAFRPLR